ncbi:hypothetical protein GQX73_g4940 [Xylaria multiplex]|uniref:ORC6 first cyclin-like domain-containing protein n=1 Tax=Xylaria multiplex TaxID=323545 RepID=A0A7C8MM99_9PEZI|nr:hypothetical protein GQX73_g4940 [Xylaria multiplex]
MNRTLEPTLYSLLPSYSTALPQPLLELASSLLTQSRHSAGTLKADEEVARSYACAHIACERLKISLDLPPHTSKPARLRTPSSKARESGLFGSAQRTPSRATPTKDASLAKFRSPAATKGDNTPTKSASKPLSLPAKRKAGGPNSALPAWMRPTIQLLCKELDQEIIGRTVFAGMQSIVAPHGRRTKDQWVNDHLTPLLAAVHCLVAGQLYVIVNKKDLDNRQYSKMRKSILLVLEHTQEKVTVRGMDEDELWIGWSDVTSKDIDKAMAEIIKRGWQNEEWFAGFEEMVKRSEPDAHDPSDDVDMEDEETRISERLHVQRADTMFQSRTVGSREFWSLLQVNREARQAVLRGRQAVFDLSLGVRVPGRLNFIDWGRDLFIWRGLGNGVYRGPAIKQPVFAYKIRHLALPCRYAQESLNKPGEMSTEFSEEELARMPAVRCLYLIIDSESFKSDPRKRDINRNDTFGTYDEYASIRGTRFPPRHVPAAVETVIPYTAKSLDGPTSLAWCQDFLQCLTRFQDEMAESVSRLCGRTINCEALVDVSPPRKWANWEDWLASNGPSR